MSGPKDWGWAGFAAFATCLLALYGLNDWLINDDWDGTTGYISGAIALIVGLAVFFLGWNASEKRETEWLERSRAERTEAFERFEEVVRELDFGADLATVTDLLGEPDRHSEHHKEGGVVVRCIYGSWVLTFANGTLVKKDRN